MEMVMVMMMIMMMATATAATAAAAKTAPITAGAPITAPWTPYTAREVGCPQ